MKGYLSGPRGVSNTPSALHGERDLAMGWLIRFSGSDDPDAYYAGHVAAYVKRLRDLIRELEAKDGTKT